MAPIQTFVTNTETIAFIFHYVIPLLIGFSFGFVLEMSGFGDSRKLAGQFYLGDMTVLKVMFTGIIVAMTLVFLASSLDLLDYSLVYVNTTYLLPGIIGGMIMGVGFIIGGFCPGTSLVASATLKLDGIFFVFGALFGVYLFGLSFDFIEPIQNATNMGRFTLPELFNWPTGLVVIAVILTAFLFFYLAEISEAVFGEKKGLSWNLFENFSGTKLKVITSLVILGIITTWLGQPDWQRKWKQIAKKENILLEKREVFIHPGELLELMNDAAFYSAILDVRDESDYNLFHLENARHLPMEKINETEIIKKLKNVPANTIYVINSNQERLATDAYKRLKAAGILNLYILEGGINHWLEIFPLDINIATKKAVSKSKNGENLDYKFYQAVGDQTTSANPMLYHHHLPKIDFVKKIKVKKRTLITGGCG